MSCSPSHSLARRIGSDHRAWSVILTDRRILGLPANAEHSVGQGFTTVIQKRRRTALISFEVVVHSFQGGTASDITAGIYSEASINPETAPAYPHHTGQPSPRCTVSLEQPRPCRPRSRLPRARLWPPIRPTTSRSALRGSTPAAQDCLGLGSTPRDGPNKALGCPSRWSIDAQIPTNPERAQNNARGAPIRMGRIPDFPVTRSHPPASWPSAANSSICRTYRKTAGEESRRRSPVANRWMRP